jgi:FemAB-related protein (PEP-CTERM system-associated)
MADATAELTLERVQTANDMARGQEPVTVGATNSTPEDRSAWDEFILGHPESSFFHLDVWRTAVRETFRHEDIYLTARRADRIVGVLPMFYVRSRIGGRMLVSVPYGVGGGIVSSDDEATAALVERAKAIAQERDCSVIDFRSARAVVPDLPVVDRYVGFERELPESPGDVLKWLPRKARAAARNGRTRFALRADYGNEYLDEVWRLYTRSMRRLASLAYPYSFFEALLREAPDRVWTSTVQWKSRTVAGLVTFLFRDTVMPYFIGTTDQAKRCSASNFIYLALMERAVEEGYRVFDFGRSRKDNEGSYNFKRFNGFEPHPLEYQYYAPPGRMPPDLSPGSAKFRIFRRVWPHVPLCITRPLGALLSRHIPG